MYEASLALGEDPERFAHMLIPPRDWSLDRTNALVNRFEGTDNLTKRIEREKLMLVIGELINATRKKVGAAVEKRDADFIRDLARRQAEAGADILDVNGGVPGREVESLEWLIGVVQEATDLPLSIDSSDPDGRAPRDSALQAAAAREFDHRRAGMFRRAAAGSQGTQAASDRAVHERSRNASGVDDRLATASRLVERLTGAGLALDDIFVDPCVIPISTGPENGPAVLEAVGCIVKRFPGVHTSVGLSNVSFGVPVRKLDERDFPDAASLARPGRRHPRSLRPPTDGQRRRRRSPARPRRVLRAIPAGVPRRQTRTAARGLS